MGKVGSSKPTQTKTIAKASTSSKSSGSSKTSSSSSSRSTTSSRPATSSTGTRMATRTVTVTKTTQAPPRSNMDKVDFGKPKLIAAATGRDPEPPKSKKTNKDDYGPMIMTPAQRHEILNNIHDDAVKFSKTETGHAVGGRRLRLVPLPGGAGAAAGGSIGAGAAIGATSGFVGQLTKVVEKVAEIIVDGLGKMGEGILEDDLL